MTHTEGPWQAISTRIYTADKREVGVATKADPKERYKANENARLMAAAPELLAAMKWIVQEIEWGHDMGGALAVARLTIEKATGQEMP